MTRSVPHAEPFVSVVPKFLDIVNPYPVAYSFDYACQLITIPAGQTRDKVDGLGTRGEERMSKHKESSDHLPR